MGMLPKLLNRGLGMIEFANHHDKMQQVQHCLQTFNEESKLPTGG